MLNHALAEYYLSRGKVSDGEHYLKSAAASGDRDVRLELVELYTAAGRDVEALAVLDSFSDDEPPGSVSVPRAAIECRMGQRDVALRRIDRLLGRIPQHGRALEVKAECLLAMARLTEALPLARAAVTAVPTSAGARFVLGQSLSASGDLDDAFAEFTEAVRLDPLHRPASRALARHALDMGRPETALVLARELVRTDPTDEDAAVMLVTALIRQHDYAGAAQALGPLLARFPASADLLARQGDLHVARGTRGRGRPTTAHSRWLRIRSMRSPASSRSTWRRNRPPWQKNASSARLCVTRIIRSICCCSARVFRPRGMPQAARPLIAK